MLRSLALLLCLFAVAACTGRVPDQVRIGLVVPLSGDRAYLGREVRDGVELAVDDLNAEGGLLGEPIDLVVRDDRDLVDLPGQLADLAERARVTAVVGPEVPAVLLGPRSPLTRRDVAAVLPTAFAGDVRAAAGTVVRTVPSAYDQAAALGRWLVDVRRIHAVAVLVADPVEGRLARDAAVDGLAAGGVRVTAVVEADPGVGDLTPSVSALRERSGDAGAVLLWAPPPVAARATRAVRDIRWDVQVAVPASAFVAEYRALAGEASEGVVLPFPFREEWFSARTERWLLRWHREHGIGSLPDLDTLVLDLPVAAMAAYDAVGLIAAAVRDAGTREPSAVAEALRTTAHDGLLRDYDLSTGEAWNPDDLYLARFHHYAVIYDADPRLDPARQRRFYRYQVQLEYVPDSVLQGPAGDVIRRALEERRRRAPDYETPLPPPEPVGRPS